MYTCTDDICDPCCDFCWYCIHGKYGEPVKCERNNQGFFDGMGYCGNFKCGIHEEKPPQRTTHPSPLRDQQNE